MERALGFFVPGAERVVSSRENQGQSAGFQPISRHLQGEGAARQPDRDFTEPCPSANRRSEPADGGGREDRRAHREEREVGVHGYFSQITPPSTSDRAMAPWLAQSAAWLARV